MERHRWVAVAVGMLGVLIITRPGVGGLNLGHVLGLGAALSYCVFTILTRVLGRTESTDAMMFMPAVTVVVVLLPVVPTAFVLTEQSAHWLLLGSVGLIGTVAHLLTVRAYRLAPASGLAPYFYGQILWVLMFGYVVFGDLPDLWMMTGSAVIIASGVYLAHRDRKAMMPETAG